MDNARERACGNRWTRGTARAPRRPRPWPARIGAGAAAVVLVAGLLAPGAAAVSLTVEAIRGSARLTDATRSWDDGLALVFSVPLETDAVVTALSLMPGTEFRVTYEASQIPRERDPSQPGSSLLRSEAWVGLPPWPLAVGLLHQSIAWRWATDAGEEQIPFRATGWGAALETRLPLTPRLMVGAELRATPWARWTDGPMAALPPHRLYFLGYDLEARYFLAPTVAVQAGYQSDTLRAVASGGAVTRDVSRSGFRAGLAIGF